MSRHPVDKFFSESLKDYRVNPSEAAKNIFLQDAERMEKTVPVKKPGRRLAFLFLAGMILLATVTGIFISRSVHKRMTAGAENKPEIATPGSHDKALAATHTEGKEPGFNGKSSTVKVHQKTTSQITAKQQNEQQLQTILPGPGMSLPSQSNKTTPVLAVNPQTSLRKMDPLSPAVSDNKLPAPGPQPVTNSYAFMTIEDNVPSHKNTDEPYNQKKNFISAGVYYSPEWMFNTLEANNSMRADNFGLEGTYHFGPYSVGTGIGLSLSTGTNEVVIGYNDYLGTYRGLDSIVFKWDEGHNYLLPVYYYTDKIVYDSLLKIDYSYYEKSYIYLQIPIILGYDFIMHKKFSLGVRLGPTLSILLQSKAKNTVYDPGEDRIMQMNNVTPERVETNWQISAGINTAFALSRRFSLEAEPDFHYYFNSVYEKSDNDKKPWSIGFRIAFLIRN